MNQKYNPKTYERLQKLIKRFEKSPLSFLIRKSRLTFLIIIFLILLGLIQIQQLPRELAPEIKIPYASVVTTYAGASPTDIEEQITKKIEAKIADIDGLKTFQSTSSFGYSQIMVEFNIDQDLDKAIRTLKDKVDEAKPDLPEDASDPQVQEINIVDQAILSFSLGGANYDQTQIKEFAENLKDKLENISNVSRVEVIGGEDREIQVTVQPDKLATLGITNNQIAAALAAYNLNFPVGSVTIGPLSYGIRIENEFVDATAVDNLIVGQSNGLDVRLKDVANVEENFEKVSTISRISINQEPVTETITVSLYKKTGGDITKMAAEAKQIVADGKGDLYPEDVEVVITTDFARYIERSINDLTQNGIGTVVIILVLLVAFLGIREAFLTSMAVPFSFFIAFGIMAFMGQSLNGITLFSLVLALGLLVDSAVVIVEGMYEKVKKYQMTGYEAAMLSVQEYAAPLISGMLTTVAAFFPLLFIKGIIGEYMRGIPIVVIATLTAALFVSLSIIPTLGTIVLKPKRLGEDGKQKRSNFLSRGLDTLSQKYRKNIKSFISVRRRRVAILAGAWGLFLLSLLLPITGVLKIEAFGSTDVEYFYVNLEMPEGTILEETDKVTQQIEDRLHQVPYVINFVSQVGASGDNEAFITVNLPPKEQRDLNSPEIADKAREALKDITQGTVEVQEESGGPPTGSPLEVRVSGPDLEELQKIAFELRDIMDAIPGTEDVVTDIRYLPGEFLITFDNDVLNYYGLTPAQVGSELRKGISGDDNLKIIRSGDEVKINLAYPEEELNSINYIKNIPIATPTGEKVAVGTLGEIKLIPSISAIKRQDEERSFKVTGRNADGITINEIMTAFQQKAATYQLPEGYTIHYGGVSQEQNEVYMDMLYKMIIGIILILFILVIQFDSYRQVLIILFTIPLAMIGVIWGMTFAGLILDIPAFVGIVSLAGIVVNNAIILIDYINKLRREKGMDMVDAAATAGKARLRPIILTTATTVLGLLPLSIREPDWRNMGFAIIFGLTFATLLTLFVVPSFYISLESMRKKKEESTENQLTE